MVKTTRAQREALFKVFRREFPSWTTPFKRIPMGSLTEVKVPSVQYRRFRETVRPFFGDKCIMVPYAGMWLGIETDGYTHS